MRYGEVRTVHYVGWGGGTASVTGPSIDLGTGVLRVDPRRDRKGWLWNFSFGYVSGFPLKAILYYLLTRETHWRAMHWAWKRERAAFEASTGGHQKWPRCSLECPKCNRELPGA